MDRSKFLASGALSTAGVVFFTGNLLAEEAKKCRIKNSYWFPPSLFNLAQKTGFDIESFIFSFAIGGIGAVLYRILFPVAEIEMNVEEKKHRRHHLYTYILMLKVLIFFILTVTTRLDHIYCGIISLFAGSLATLYCRPDLKGKIWIGGLLFMLLYFFYFGSILVFFSAM